MVWQELTPHLEKYHLRYIPPSMNFFNRLSRFLLRRLFIDELLITMDWTSESIEEQTAYLFLSMNDAEAVGLMIFEQMNEASKGTQRDITSAQSHFMKVTKILSKIDPEYSLECSAHYMKLVTANFGVSEKDFNFK